MNYWNNHNIKYAVYKEIIDTANSLIYAFSNPNELNFKEQLKWLVELKLDIITNNMCRYCNKDSPCCECNNYCSKCNEEHNGFMNSQLIKHIFKSIEKKTN